MIIYLAPYSSADALRRFTLKTQEIKIEIKEKQVGLKNLIKGLLACCAFDLFR